MPSIHAHDVQRTYAAPHASSGTRIAHENELRRRSVLLRYDSDEAALYVLLRFEGAEESTTRGKLRELGFVPSSSPASASVMWKRHVSTEDLAHVCARLHEALGQAVLDLGATFVDTSRASLQRAKQAMSYWAGPFLVEIGGTRRSVVFPANAPEAELDRAFADTREHYYANDFHGATE
jgi:hypothetical protein